MRHTTAQAAATGIRPEGGIGHTIAAYDAMAAEYAARFDDVDVFDHRKLFSGQVPAGGKILDAGCGHGRDCRLFQRDGFQVTGVDLSSGLLSEARQRTSAALIRADVRELPFLKSSFDGVWSCAVLHHLDGDDFLEALLEAARVLRLGGAMFLTIRAGEGEELRSDPSGRARWFRFHTDDQVDSLLRVAGFERCYSTTEPGAVAGTWLNVHAVLTVDQVGIS